MDELIPLFGVSIPLVVVLGKFIVQPLLRSRAPAADAQRLAFLEQRVNVLEQGLEGMERSMGRLTEENDFLRQLTAPVPAAANRPGSAA